MADTDHHPHVGDGPVEGDGISYRGIVWFVAIMVATVVGSQILMVGAFKWLERDVARADPARAPLARPQGQQPPGPSLLRLESGAPELNEPGNLVVFREREDAILRGYTYDPASGAARIPIDRAKDLLIERGLPARAAPAGN
jgi:hypothetical protein